MDLRYQKTEKSIREAFLTLRRSKPLEKITLKELAELAVINKGTFYLHYHDIYELAETLENQIIESCVAVIGEENILSPRQILLDLAQAFVAHREQFDILFSDGRLESAAQKLEASIKERVYKTRPSLRKSKSLAVKMSATVYGCFYAYAAYSARDPEGTVACLAQFAENCMRRTGR